MTALDDLKGQPSLGRSGNTANLVVSHPTTDVTADALRGPFRAAADPDMKHDVHVKLRVFGVQCFNPCNDHI